MVGVTFVNRDGSKTSIDVQEGFSVMEGGVRGGVDGLDADCGGQGACATCHVYVEKAWLPKLPPPSEDELAMLEFAIETDPETSRLSCQILCTAELDGLVVRVPERQS
jgi:2Fe-2S ferredoxin